MIHAKATTKIHIPLLPQVLSLLYEVLGVLTRVGETRRDLLTLRVELVDRGLDDLQLLW